MIRKHSILAGATGLGLSLLSSLAYAQDAASAKPAEEQLLRVVVAGSDNDPRIVLARRISAVRMADLDKQIREMMAAEMAESLEAMPQAEAAWMRKTASDLLITHAQGLFREVEQIYARELTIAELEAIAQFYETEAGRSLARKEMAMGRSMAEAIQRFQVAYLTELMTKFCTQFDCESLAANGQGQAKSNRR